MEVKNDILKNIYQELLKNINNSFSKLDKKLNNEEFFIKSFDKRDLSDIKSYCTNISLNPQVFFKHYFFEQIDKIDNYFKLLLNVEEVKTNMDYDNGYIYITVIYSGKEIISINLIEKTYSVLISDNKNEKLKSLREEVLKINNDLELYENLLKDEKSIKAHYSLNKIKFLNKGEIKSLEEAIHDLEKKILEKSENKDRLIENINNIYMSKDEFDIKIEELADKFNEIDFDKVK